MGLEHRSFLNNIVYNLLNNKFTNLISSSLYIRLMKKEIVRLYVPPNLEDIKTVLSLIGIYCLRRGISYLPEFKMRRRVTLPLYLKILS